MRTHVPHEKIAKMLYNLPPFKKDVIPDDVIDCFQSKGQIGWNFLTEKILKSSNFHAKL